MPHQITYECIQQKVEVKDSNPKSLLEISLENQIAHVHECGGNGKCSTCRVKIIDGMKNLSPPTTTEKKFRKLKKWDANIRLACQCQVNGDVRVQKLIKNNGDINALQTEELPEGDAEERSLAILFCDIRNYTALSSHNASFDMAYFLNRFYTELGEPILMNNGIIYQYVGDEIIGIFGIQETDPEKNSTDAVRAALGMHRALERLNSNELKDFEVKLKVGIGINFGQAYIGHLGHPSHRQFSVIGDAVNVASRIQGKTKITQSKILISNSLYEKLSKEMFKIDQCHLLGLEGKEGIQKLLSVDSFKNTDTALELQSSLFEILNFEPSFATLFYNNLFQAAPELRRLFTRNMKEQGKLLTHMLSGIVYSLARPDYLEKGLSKLGKDHQKYGVRPEHYPMVAEILCNTLGEIFTGKDAAKKLAAWKEGIHLIIRKMMPKSSKMVLAS